MSTSLVLYQPGADGALFRRQGLLTDLEGALRRLRREYARDVEKVRQFERRYRPAVGARYDELERLRESINRGWEALEQAREGPASDMPAADEAPCEGEGSSAPRPGGKARGLFLDLARRIHPDLAADEFDRRRRHEIMAEATLAYRDNNHRRLQWLLEHWQAESEPIVGFGLGSSWLRTNRQIAWTRYRIRETQYALGQLHASPVARIMEEHERGRATGRNLMLEMRQQIGAQLEEAEREMDRLLAAVDQLEPTPRANVLAAIGS